MSTTWTRDTFEITTDPQRANVDAITAFLTTSYWAKGIPAQTVAKSLQNSIGFSLFEGERQVGFARVITDRATFAFLADVFVLEAYRGRGLATWLLECVFEHPELQALRRWMLGTRDAHGLYERFEFCALRQPEIFMERHYPDIYARPSS
jgi:GNAT superfamily N-acetyltransferase